MEARRQRLMCVYSVYICVCRMSGSIENGQVEKVMGDKMIVRTKGSFNRGWAGWCCQRLIPAPFQH